MNNIDISPEELTRLKTLAQKATPGPWCADRDGYGVHTQYTPLTERTFGYGCGNDFVCDLNDGEYHEYHDAKEQMNTDAYIAAVHPGVIIALCEEIERLREGRATPALRWTKEPPKEAGWYWHHIPPHFGAVIEWIAPEEQEPGDGEWAGPIPEPEER